MRQRQLAAPRDEMDWDYDRTAQMPRAPSLDAAAAERALSVNKLREAIALAERALVARITWSALAALRPRTPTSRCMLLVQAIAHRWLGDYTAAERCAARATRRLERGTGAWYAALPGTSSSRAAASATASRCSTATRRSGSSRSPRTGRAST
jgi:hypothetical protein